MSRKLKVIGGIYGVVALVLFVVLGMTASEYCFKRAMAYISIPVLVTMCILGIRELIYDITELRFNLLYRSRLKSNFRRLIKAACIYSTHQTEIFRFGILHMVLWSMLPVLVGAAAYVVIFYNFWGSFNLLIALAIAIVLFMLGWFDTVVCYGIYQLEDDEPYQPLNWY